ncbi:MAG: hypothetical protein ACXVC1_02375 [Tumebacillaceae bacterium]
MAKSIVVAAFPTYQEAHRCMQRLHDTGLNDFSVVYLQNSGDQNGDGLEGFYPTVTPDLQSVVSAPVEGEIEAPQLNALSGPDNQRTQVPIEERLRSYGMPEQSISRSCQEVRNGHTLAVLRDSDRLENIAQLLKGETNYCEIVSGQ